jgi:MFS family permease
MPTITSADLNAAEGDRLARRNALILALAQALAGANSAVIFGTAGIIGGVLAGDKVLATVPVSTFVVGMWVGTLPTGAIAKRFGRLAAFLTGTCFGLVAGLLCGSAVILGSFALLCVGTLFGGLYASAHQSYRFAAADTASPAFRPRAISWVMAGGILAGVFGPQLIIFTKDVLPQYLFAASYFAQSVVALVAAGVLAFVRIPKLAPVAGVASGGRPLVEIFAQPKLIAAVICGVAGYATMNLIMTSAPVAMVEHHHAINDAALGLQWHVMAMYGPSFFTGALIIRFGSGRVVAMGLAIIAVGAVFGLMGMTVGHFWIDLILLGIGWNFSFVGATATVTECHRPHERNKVQAVNDFLVFGSMVVASFLSGKLLADYGWGVVNWVVIGAVGVAGLTLVWVALARPPQPESPK